MAGRRGAKSSRFNRALRAWKPAEDTVTGKAETSERSDRFVRADRLTVVPARQGDCFCHGWRSGTLTWTVADE